MCTGALSIVCVVVFPIRNVFFMRIWNFRDAMQVCVSQCPPFDIDTAQQAKDFAVQYNSKLCHYKIDVDDYDDTTLYTDHGPCPKLSVFKR